ncbi:MAG: tol-pal system-associated acyl-CoA thioesterase [SAR86 cluster bacterium]|jgi:acyl-CoA thioester hydrolase|nr:tol-pal system-associated acyl-CoA thioesterase [SAR86 cluster bacterium]|tara:strand:+ start:105 stop:503 length:399 start_codon:yes stop_codon:yes gene_type:complete
MHILPIKVYYEDTDAQGVVYYANYLKFFERARTEFLREIGYEQKNLMEQGAIFVVREVAIEFKKPAYLDQQIEVHTRIIKAGKVSFDFTQEVFTDEGNLLCGGIVKCGCLSLKNFKPKALPSKLYQGMKSLL